MSSDSGTNPLEGHVQLMASRGAELLNAGRFQEALACFEIVREVCPGDPRLLLYAGAALHGLGRLEDAVAVYRHALSAAPDYGELHNNLGNSLMASGRFAEAAECYSRAAALLPGSPVPVTANATALQALGRYRESEEKCRAALNIDSGFAAAHWNLALNLLTRGEYASGWREYEWRWQRADFTSPRRHLDRPLWDGSPLHGRTILLHAEQGLGDVVQFVRYAPMVAGFGGKVLLECHPELVTLMRSVEGVTDAMAFDAAADSDFACHIPLLSLPRVFGTTLETIPSRIPYLSQSAAYTSKWQNLTALQRSRLKVGLVWAGKSYPDPLRSCPWGEMKALLAINGVSFFSLQFGMAGRPGGERTDAGDGLVDLTGKICDFSDTAALISQLDLIISIDTSVAHVAGAMGKQTWLLLPYAADWRWLLHRSDSPWYPTMTLFRQQIPGDWNGLITRVKLALISWIRKKSFEEASKD